MRASRRSIVDEARGARSQAEVGTIGVASESIAAFEANLNSSFLS